MKRLADLELAQNIRAALQAARDRLHAVPHVDQLVLFGSVVRGTADEESDADLLVILKEPPDHSVRNLISSIILDINLEFGANLSELIVDRATWDYGIPSVLPIRRAVQEEGITL